MKNLIYSILTLATISILSGCATIIGGGKYFAHVKVPDHPNAKIIYKGAEMGQGDAVFKVKRSEAKRLTLTVKEKGFESKDFDFKKNTIRGWSVVGSILVWNTMVGGIPIFYGFIIDLANGAFVKPNIHEKGVSKINYKNFAYTLDYDKLIGELPKTPSGSGSK